MQIERLFGIVMTLLNEECVSSKTLAEKYQVSRRTIQRDVDILSVAGIPIYAKAGRYGGYHLLEPFKMDKTTITENENQWIKELVRSLSHMIKDPHLIQLEDKYKLLSDDHNMPVKIDFSSWIGAHHFSDISQVIYDAIVNQKKLNITYISQEHMVERVIHPYQLIYKESGWYCYGYCEMRNDFRYFKLIRILKISILDERFIGQPIKVETPFAETMEKASPIIITFKKKALAYILAFFNPSDFYMESDYIVIKTIYPIDHWLVEFLLAHVDDLIDITPETLKQAVTEKLASALARLS